MDAPLVALADLEGIRPVASLENRVAGGLEAFADQLSQTCLVLDEHDRFGASRQFGDGGSWQRCHNFRSIDPRQIDLEGRALARLAVDKDVPPTLLDDPMH